jgi:potassium/hydrogen antiporter
MGHDVVTFAGLTVLVSVTGLLAVLSAWLTAKTRIPAPLFFLIAAAIAAQAFPKLHDVPHDTVERLVTVALVLILFDGGLGIGWKRLKPAATTTAVVGVLGTFLTAAAIATTAHLAFDFSWWVALLVGTAVSPTDPAVVFAVLAGREIAGRSGTILEGESGANDPVGIALMAGLLSAGGVSAAALGHVAALFLAQMAVGAVLGLAAGWALKQAMKKLTLPAEGLYPLALLFAVGLLYGVTTLAHGSGFLAVFIAGIVLGDVRAPFKREIERFHSALAGLGEIVAFLALGVTVDLGELAHRNVWASGLVIAAVLILIVRPVLVGLCLLPVTLERGEKVFLLWAGLKGAVPILLGTLLLGADVPDGQRLYGIVIVVVVTSVLVQGSTVPFVARRLHVPMKTLAPAPWALGVRLRDEPRGVHHLTVRSGSRADGTRVSDLDGDLWVSVIIRDSALLRVHGDTQLQADDRLMVLADPALSDVLEAEFG